ncbi:MAG TPA: SIR2 family protein, partial [Thermoanaerobaculia bacterium]
LRLAFLACCQSATRSPADALRGLAPALVSAGVPAVVAMQDLVPVETARRFAAVFYGRLLVHGLADLAANEARSALLAAGLPGAAIPVAFLRLRNGRLLAFRGQILGRRASGFWTTLLDNVADGECTPILGPGVTRRLLPSPADLARALAARYGYPFPDGDNLPRVAQFVGTLDPLRLRKEVLRLLADGFRRWHGLPADPRNPRGLSQALRDARWPELSRQTAEVEIHHQLADLGLPLYLTTNFDSFMTLALEARGRKPRREALPWRNGAGTAGPAGPHRDLDPPPTPEEPAVLHLFGTDEDPLSLVLSEDDHLDYLARISRDHEYILPAGVAAALARTTLLLLGYHLHDLDLKILLRGLLSHLDATQWRRLHVAVQVDARADEQGAFEEVKRYLESYFGDSQIDVYWGSTRQFVADLHARWRERHG